MGIRAGSATRTINCELGDDLLGQLHRRFAERIRDDLEANFLYLADDAEAVLLVNLDLAGCFHNPYIRTVCAAIEKETGVPARNVIITNTHTHDGPDTFGLLFDAPLNEAYLAKLHGWLVDGAKEAVAGACPARTGCGLGHAHVGYNRRLCWADTTHSMYGDSSRADFTGIEGPDDPAHAVLFAVDEDGRYIGILHNNCCHTTCMESASFASADFPGEARRLIRDGLKDAKVPVLYLQGASGDTSPWNMMEQGWHHDGEVRVREVGELLANETLRLMREAELVDAPVLRHAYEDLTVDVRLPGEDVLAEARAVKARGPEANRWDYVIKVDGALKLYEGFKDNPVDQLAVHAVRVGDFAIATNPCEFYCQFGLDIKRRSPAKITAVSQLTDGFSGYCPTVYGLMGGGYSGDAIYWCRLEPYAGYKIVDAAAKLLGSLWRG